jgi:hypothetical protein
MATLLSQLETQARRHLLEPAAISTPGAPTVTNIGTPGAKTVTYKIVAINGTGTTDAGAAGTTSAANATLDGTNYNHLTWTAVTGAVGYWIFRTATNGTAPTTIGRIAVLGAVTSYDDQGGAGDLSTAPIINTTGLTSPLWSSDEIIDLAIAGIKDMWGKIIDLGQEHFLTIDASNVTVQPNTSTLSGVPSDVFRVYLIEPADMSATNPSRSIKFVPRDYNSDDFIAARSRSLSAGVADQSGTSLLTIFYATVSQGPPVNTMVVQIAPMITDTLALRFVYIPSVATLTSSSTNPIPGESDQAIVAYIVAFGRAKEREDRSPDPNWLAIYKTESDHILTRMTPRQVQEPEVVEDFFAQYL